MATSMLLTEAIAWSYAARHLVFISSVALVGTTAPFGSRSPFRRAQPSVVIRLGYGGATTAPPDSQSPTRLGYTAVRALSVLVGAVDSQSGWVVKLRTECSSSRATTSHRRGVSARSCSSSP